MSSLGHEVMESASRRLGDPFRNHFKPANLCEGGILTVDECMERGMDAQGYDCSGLAIASICEALGLASAQWPRELRHTQQHATLPTKESFEPGDLRLYYSSNNRIHLGIATDTDEVIHASGRTGVVERSMVTDPTGSFEAVRAVAIESLVKALRLDR